jgi:hypothetical protein
VTSRLAALWRRGQVGWPQRYPVAQFPNPPLIAAGAGAALAAVTDGTVHDVGRVVAIAGLAVWAWQELTSGVNAFRRALGAVALVAIAVRLAGEL